MLTILACSLLQLRLVGMQVILCLFKTNFNLLKPSQNTVDLLNDQKRRTDDI